MQRSYRVLQASVGEPIYLPQLCVAPMHPTGHCACVAEGVSPKRYLHPRRMNLARRTLLPVAVDTDNVMSIAARFWELGHFAVDYHTLPGEAPSTTLRSGRLH
jgi:Helix-turn-helix domain